LGSPFYQRVAEQDNQIIQGGKEKGTKGKKRKVSQRGRGHSQREGGDGPYGGPAIEGEGAAGELG